MQAMCAIYQDIFPHHDFRMEWQWRNGKKDDFAIV